MERLPQEAVAAAALVIPIRHPPRELVEQVAVAALVTVAFRRRLAQQTLVAVVAVVVVLGQVLREMVARAAQES